MRSSWLGGLFAAVSIVAVLGQVAAAAAPGPPAAVPQDPPAAVPQDPTAAVPPGPTAAAAAVPTAAAASTAAVITARYAFNGRSSSILDESGHGHTLTVVSGQGGVVRHVVHGQGSALAFPPRCGKPVCPHVALQTPSSADLNPGRRTIAYGADVLLTPGQTSSGQNVVQKGYASSSSQWKLQIDGAAGRPSCVLVDHRRSIVRIATSSVTAADGRWHSLRCQRAGTTLVIFVDGVLRGRTTVPAGLTVTNNRPLSIGGKGAYADNDQFNGALDNVWVQIG